MNLAGPGIVWALTTVCPGDRDVLFRDMPGWCWIILNDDGCSVNGDLGYNWELGGPVSRWWCLNDSLAGSRDRAAASHSACHSDRPCAYFHPLRTSPVWGELPDGVLYATDFFQHFLFSHSERLAIRQTEQLISCGQMIDLSSFREIVCLPQVYGLPSEAGGSHNTFQHSLLYQLGIQHLSKGKSFTCNYDRK